jgi:hypothetical protein
VGATVGQYAAIWAGPHACYNGWDNASQHRKVKSIAKPSRSRDRGLELTRVNLDFTFTSNVDRRSLVSASHYGAENTSLHHVRFPHMEGILAHTARRSMRAALG